MEDNIVIRAGRATDVEQVLQLVKELAEYEKAPLEVSNTVEMMLEDGFGTNPVFGLFVAENSERIIGIAIYYTKYSTWKGKCLFLEDIIVTETYRGKGIGKKLFLKVAEIAADRRMARMEWQVLDWNIPAIEFYKSFGANLDPEWINGKLTAEQLQKINQNPVQKEIA